MIKSLYDIYKDWSANGGVFIYSDPHFGDEEMKYIRKNYIGDEEQIKRINSVVHKNDTLIILGDIGDISYIPKIKAGYKVLIKGNHDAGLSVYKRKMINKTYTVDNLEDNEKSLRKQLREEYPEHDITIINITDHSTPFTKLQVGIEDRMFDEVYDGPVFISDKLLLSHEPIDLPFCYNIHGHDHSFWHANDEKHFNCCAEHINYTPINLNDFIKSGVLSKIDSIHRITIDKQANKKQLKSSERTRMSFPSVNQLLKVERPLTNLWDETIECLHSHNKIFEDVKVISGNDFKITNENFMQLAKDTNYDNDFGISYIAADLKLYGDDFIMYRERYDGSEKWIFLDTVCKNEKTEKINALMSDLGFESLKSMNCIQ